MYPVPTVCIVCMSLHRCVSEYVGLHIGVCSSTLVCSFNPHNSPEVILTQVHGLAKRTQTLVHSQTVGGCVALVLIPLDQCLPSVGAEGGPRARPVRLQAVQADVRERRLSNAAEDGLEGGRGPRLRGSGHQGPHQQVSARARPSPYAAMLYTL